MARKGSAGAKGGKKAKGAAADPDVYVAMLFVATAALVTGIIFLYIECARYNWMLGK